VLGYGQRGNERCAVGLGNDDRSRHLWVLGATGAGKTTMLQSMAVSDAAAGGGFCIIDPHGDLVERVLTALPDARLGDVRILDAGDIRRPVRLNPLAVQGEIERAAVVQDLGEMFYDLFDPHRTGIIGPRFEAWLRMGMLTLLEGPTASILDVPRLFLDPDYLRERFQYTKDPIVSEFWIREMGQTSDYHKSEMLGYFCSKFERFRSNPVLQHLLADGANDLDFRQAMKTGQIVLINLNKSRIGEVNAQLLGYLYLACLWTAALQRGKGRTFTVYVDEYQTFTRASLPRMAAESRKFGIPLVVAHQATSQLPDSTAAVLAANLGNLVSFRLGPEDARRLSPRLGPAFDEQRLTHLANFEAAAQLLQDGVPTAPFSLFVSSPPAERDADGVEAISEHSWHRLRPQAPRTNGQPHRVVRSARYKPIQ